jgi:hypothetical protein
MRRTGILALSATLLALLLVPQANAAIGVGGAQRATANDVHQVTFDRLFERDRKHKMKLYKHHKKHKKHKHKHKKHHH